MITKDFIKAISTIGLENLDHGQIAVKIRGYNKEGEERFVQHVLDNEEINVLSLDNTSVTFYFQIC